MSSSASGLGFRPPTDWEDFSDDKEEKSYTQEPIFEGSNIHVERASMSCSYGAGCSDTVDGGYTNPAYHNPSKNLPQYTQYSQRTQDTACLHEFQLDQHPSQYRAHCPPDHGEWDPPPSYTSHEDVVNASLRYDACIPQRTLAIGQQPAHLIPTADDTPSSVVTYTPSATEHCFVRHPEEYSDRPLTIIVHPILEDPPPHDYMCYSILVTFFCSITLGLMAVSESRRCRRAIADGDFELAKEKSIAARGTSRASVALGIVEYIVVGVVYGIYWAYVR